MRPIHWLLSTVVVGLPMAWLQAGPAPTSSPAGTARPASRPASQPAAGGVHAFTLKDINGKARALAEYRGKVLLIVNVASRCGYTPQYAGLEELYRRYTDRGLVVLGVPSNDFGKQEPGTNAQIKEFCSTRYHTTFPMLAKVSVAKGPEQAPLYRYLTSRQANGVLDATVAWNFNKFLVGRDGRVIRYYPSKVTPGDESLRRDIEAALGIKAD
jgi:glutathione peroxidase